MDKMRAEVASSHTALMKMLGCDFTHFQFIIDDFFWQRKRATPNDKNTFSDANDVTTVVVKMIDLAKSLSAESVMLMDPFLDMLCGSDATSRICSNRNRCYIFGSECRRMNPVLLPGSHHGNHDVIDQFVTYMTSDSSAHGCPDRDYGEQKVHLRYRRRDNPYASQHRQIVEHGPVNLDNTYSLNILPIHLNSFEGLCAVMEKLQPSIRLYLNNHKYCIIAGDWHLYTCLRKWIVVNQAEDYVHGIVPIPGLFHIGLNAQDVIIKKFFHLLSSLWKRVFPRSRTELSITLMKIMPTMRKNFLGSLMNAWDSVKSRISRMIQSRIESGEILPVQWVSLYAMFTEFLPISLDIYDCAMNGSEYWNDYHTLLFRALRMFARLGKKNYLALIIMWIGDLVYWKNYHPSLYKMVRCGLSMMSEEEIELFHSTVRPLVTGCHSNVTRQTGELEDNADIFVKIAYNGYTRKSEKSIRRKRKRSELTGSRVEESDYDSVAAGVNITPEEVKAATGTLAEAITWIFEKTLSEHLKKPAKYCAGNGKHTWETHSQPGLTVEDCTLPLEGTRRKRTTYSGYKMSQAT